MTALLASLIYEMYIPIVCILLVSLSTKLVPPLKSGNLQTFWDKATLSIKENYPSENKGPYNNNMIPSAPNDASNASSIFCIGEITPNTNSSIVSNETTLRRGSLLGTARPIWIKVTESECRIAWLRQMISKRLIVRDLEAFY